ncbi:MAG: DUF2905 domain-containing protein [Myxococcota bacterium]
MDGLGRMLIVTGALLLALGLLIHLSPSLPLLGRLPGDVRIERPGFRLYVPITSCVLISLLLSGLLQLFSRLR